MKSGTRREILVWVGVGLSACAGMSLLHTVTSLVEERRADRAWWPAAYYTMWAALTPFIFTLARRVPFRRDRWVRPLLFHLATSVVVSLCASAGLEVIFGALVLGVPLPAPADVLTPFWTDIVTLRALADTLFYWMILAAGVVLQTYDESQARRRQAADLERALVSAQVDALRMKLQPHFLFNTLNALNVLAVEQDAQAVATIAERLAALLRSSIDSNGRQMATVADEMAWLDQYLNIQETRFGDRLRVVRHIEPAAQDALVPSLILQPVIENAIKHGFSRLIDARCVTIAIGRDADMLVLSVIDDGPGLPPAWDIHTGAGRGLKNVVERLDALYAGASAFTLENAASRGTIATLRVPWRVTRSDTTPGAPRTAG